jgi:hypothetical protein|tara:strand:+ start:466 stop:648 length:183 start_codon:yes stop_codon:yes gene_type:complete
MFHKLYIITKRWWRTTIYLKKWKAKKEQVLPAEITEGLALKKVPSGARVVNINLAKKGKK